MHKKKVQRVMPKIFKKRKTKALFKIFNLILGGVVELADVSMSLVDCLISSAA